MVFYFVESLLRVVGPFRLFFLIDIWMLFACVVCPKSFEQFTSSQFPFTQRRVPSAVRAHDNDSSEILSCCSLMIYRRRRETQFPVSSRWEREYNDVPFPLPNITSVLSICGPNLLNIRISFFSPLSLTDWLTDLSRSLSLSLSFRDRYSLIGRSGISWRTRSTHFQRQSGDQPQGEAQYWIIAITFVFLFYLFLPVPMDDGRRVK